jgi:hypothetical protein
MLGMLLITAVVDAQQGRGRGRGGFGGGGFGRGFGVDLLGLTRVEKVQQELDMLEDQVAAVQKLSEEQRGARGRGRGPGGGRGDGARGGGRPGGDGAGRGNGGGRGGRPGGGDLSDEEREARVAEFQKQREERAKQNEEKLAEILLPHQLDRLKEIHLQQQGTGALQSSAVVAKLSITDEQKKTLADLSRENQTEMRSQMREIFQGGGGGDREEMMEKFAKLRTEAEQKVMAVLTDDQKTQFAAMKGEPFEMPRSGFGGGRGRGGRPGGGGRPERPARPEA